MREFERPREKMLRAGPAFLSDVELLAVLLGSGIQGKDVFAVAREIIKLAQKEFSSLTVETLMRIEGVGLAKACSIAAAIEFSRRFLLADGVEVHGAQDAILLVPELRGKRQEHFITITLDGAHKMIRKRTVFIGTLNQSIVHPREIFADALTDRAASIIFIHNHPAGNPEPSASDVVLTKRLIRSAKLLGIDVLDHIIVGKEDYFSFQANELLTP